MKIEPVVKRIALKDTAEELENLRYWLSRPPQERIAAVTKFVKFSLSPGQRMDRTVYTKRKMHDA
ncbi:hypothetical protein [Mucilaginibacter sp.]